jgi:hypothetical protein
MANQRVAFFVEGVRTAARLATTQANASPDDGCYRLTAQQALICLAQDLESIAATFERMQGGWDDAVADPALTAHVAI